MSETAVSDPMILHPDEIERFDRGNGVKTVPLVGKWNTRGNKVTTGMTIFAPGTGIPLHTHNVEETVIVLEGEATVEIVFVNPKVDHRARRKVDQPGRGWPGTRRSWRRGTLIEKLTTVMGQELAGDAAGVG
jgi:hypothetical protein